VAEAEEGSSRRESDNHEYFGISLHQFDSRSTHHISADSYPCGHGEKWTPSEQLQPAGTSSEK
jgi:hypothetical protein